MARSTAAFRRTTGSPSITISARRRAHWPDLSSADRRPRLSRKCAGRHRRWHGSGRPQQVSAGIGNLRAVPSAPSRSPGCIWGLEGSYGGRYGLDGMDAVRHALCQHPQQPHRGRRSRLPLRVNRYELRDNMVVPGEWRGGIGSVRVFTYLADGGFSVEGDGQKHRPWGFDGGTDGHPGELIMETDTGKHGAQGPLPEGGARRVPPTAPSGGYGASGSAAIRRPSSTTCSTVSSRRRSPASTIAWSSRTGRPM